MTIDRIDDDEADRERREPLADQTRARPTARPARGRSARCAEPRRDQPNE